MSEPSDWRHDVLRTVTTVPPVPPLSVGPASSGTPSGAVRRPLPPAPAAAPAAPVRPGRRGLAARLVRAGSGADRFAAEYGRVATMLERGVPTGRLVAIVSPSGGTGRTTVAAAAALAAAGVRGDATAVLDLGRAPSPLPLRVGFDGSSSTPSGPDDLVPVPGTALRAATGPVTTPAEVPELLHRLASTRALSWLDCPAGLDDPVTAAVLAEAHAAIVVARPTPFGVQQAEIALTRLRGAGVACLVVLNVGVAASGGLERGASRRLGALARTQGLPADRRLAADAPIVLGRLQDATRLAVTRIAAEALHLALDGVAP